MFGIELQHWHPLLVHFPIALWTLGTVFYLLSFFGPLYFLRQASIWMGLVGCGMGFLAAEMGEKSAEIIGNTICEDVMTLLLKHEDQAESTNVIMAVAWSLAAIQEYILARFLSRISQFRFICVIAAIGMCLGMMFLTKTGHKGFQLVYQGGVAVEGVVRKCK
jgi:uncharacterized membrane protein